MAGSTYAIIDEPQPSRWSKFITSPFLLLLGFMFLGTWVSWLWFAVNAFLLGSPTRIKEVTAVLVGFVGSVALISMISYLVGAGVVDSKWVKYCMLAVFAWKLTVAYYLFYLQAQVYEIYTHFHEDSGLGIFILVGLYFLTSKMNLEGVVPDFWFYVMS